MKWPFTYYVNDLPEGVGGRTTLFVIRIAEKYRDDVGIYRHELTHVKQGAWTLFLLHWLLYILVAPYRLWAEVQAYREQMKWPDSNGEYLSLDVAAYRLALPCYDLSLTAAEAKTVLQEM